MKSFIAFLKKEWQAQLRTGRLMILGCLFAVLGIMNPAIAKMTPWLLATLADTLSESGLAVTAVTVDAMTSWTQFFKNIPMGLLVFLLLESSIFTEEYQSGTLVLTLTKGFERYKVVLSKSVMLLLLWTACHWSCFAITYGYNAFFWDNAAARSLVFSAACWWLLGVWGILLSVLLSTIARANTGVLVGTGAVFVGVYVISLFPKSRRFSPLMLADSPSLLSGAAAASSYRLSIVVTVLSCAAFAVLGIAMLNRKQL